MTKPYIMVGMGLGFLKIMNLLVLKVYAQAGDPGLINPLCPLGEPNCTDSGFIAIANKVISALLSIATPIMGIMILIGGFQIMTAQGDTEKVGNGRKTITYAVIGFVIILMAKAAVLIVISIVNGPTPTK